ncbi:MAG: TIGR01777 family oxidoreductase [Bacteroidetes bacterium]|nr:TIGR01777 family oxidoreductase [Bacteroidota bacterium]
MKILISGGSGFIGRNLHNSLSKEGHYIKILTRDKDNKYLDHNTLFSYDYFDNGNIENFDIVINLSGESIGKGRWTSKRKEKIFKSRIDTTSRIVKAINTKKITPILLINASAIGYYGNRGDEELNESSLSGNDFLSQVCVKWEEEAQKANTRVVNIRTGLVLGDNDAFKKLILPFNLYLGGIIGSGNQWVSWIHIEDLVNAVSHIIQDETIEGPINITSPNALIMKEFQRVIGKALKKPFWLSIPEFALRLIMGEMAAIVLNSQKVFPKKLIASGFQFKYPEATDSISNLIKK